MRLPEPGEIFNGTHKLLRELGRGGFAAVFQARDLQVDRDVAIKVLLPGENGYRQDVEQRFMREARVIAKLHHPNTITMFDFGRTDEGLIFMVFEFVQGTDLEHVLQRGALPVPVVIHILAQLLGALVEAHELGVLHRDIKPANVIIFAYMDDPHRVKLIDFGIAKPLVDATGEPSNLTRDGMVVGTPRYMAPEQFFGSDLTPAADLYSLGLVVHEMLRGDRAIEAETPQAIVRRQLGPEPIQVPEQCAPPALRAIVDKMTAREESDRFSSAIEALSALSRVGTSSSEAAGPRPASDASGSQVSGVEPAPRTSWAAHAALGVVAGLAILGVLAVSTSDRSDDEPREVSIPRALMQARTPLVAARPADVGVVGTDARGADSGAVAAHTDGCGVDNRPGRLRKFGVRVGTSQREWFAYTPRSYEADKRHPVVMLFHRTSRNAQDFFGASAMRTLADEKGFVVLSFQAASSASPWAEVNDPEFVRVALAEMSMELCLDVSRVFAVGDGGGGRFARELPCQMPISAVATAASGQHPGEAMCASTPPTPMIRLYGAKDLDVPAAGGPGCIGGRPFLSAREIEAGWRDRNRCRGNAQRWVRHRAGTCQTWTCEASFVSCSLDGGHDWPTAPAPLFKLPSCAAEPPDFPMGETIWRFFDEEGRVLEHDAGFGSGAMSR